ncbi:sciellin [Tiliqua scincoides]|uniref:sciellin n=1 Tax=Tiliqua scincoides TaxID=71010 RepID=UPI003462A81F
MTTVGKPSPNKSETKNASLAMKSRQQVINEVNKRRTLLQDNSWIKKRPEEENADENYGKVVLNQYKSQDSLHRNVDEKDDQKALLSRYRSDTTLNRISSSSDADKVNKLPILDSRPSNSLNCDFFLSKGSDLTGSDTSPVKKKRQSWMPPPVSSQKPLTDGTEVHERQDLDNLIEVKAKGDKSDKRSQDLDDLIVTKDSTVDRNKKRSQDLDNLIEVKAKGDKSDKRGRDLDDLIDVNNAAQKNRRSQDLDDLIVIKSSTMDQNKKRYNGSRPKNTIVYTRTYDNSSFPRDAYEDSVSGKSIKTVYSTSDRAVIDKEMCTYCRKPLGTDTKMILDTLQICCHATCFKCEVCKEPLENLKAGDSIWIYKNTVHCSPCYSDVKASWVY